jgi:GalNAc-alpha-(1->4)-GalNAc-alpha-(1->3)-diNAcBac-PP-undecaprenol alpha-1,4-N-acetyl-D-galactosaminyltransferase
VRRDTHTKKMRKNHIAFLINSMTSGGAERVLSIVANKLAVAGYRISIYTLESGSSFYELHKNINYRPLGIVKKPKNIAEKLFNNIDIIKQLKAVLLENKPDVLITFMTKENLFGIIAARKLRIPVIISERNTYLAKKGLLHMFRYYLYPKADALVVLNSLDEAYYHKFCHNIHTIQNPLHLRFYSDFKETRREKIILSVGRLEYQKGFDNLLSVFQRISAEYPDWKLVIVGEGSQKDDLIALSENLGIALKVVFTGRVTDVIAYYRKSSIFILSSRYEGFPNVLCEAMSQGLACISFNCISGPWDIIDNYKNGILVKNQDNDELYKALKELISNKKLRISLSQTAKQIRKKLSKEKTINKWMELVTEFVD